MLKISSKAQDWYIVKKEITARNGANQVCFDRPINGITIRVTSTDGAVSESITVKLADGNRSIPVYLDPHVDQFTQYAFLPLETSTECLEILCDAADVKWDVWGQYVQPISMLPREDARGSTLCSLPNVVPQFIWRQGLPDPPGYRQNTPVRHGIVHHSATPNSDTNSLQLVRSFYIQHTQINGWDDIGYNYLIGHDGVVFAGRDTITGEVLQDFVLGAHFCGKNRFTMGVCVIGGFQESSPDPRAIHSLTQLMSWKMFKDKMQVLDSLRHPDTLTGELLPVLAGHRDGCSTECPGQQLYDLLPQLRQDIYANILSCNAISADALPIMSALTLYPNPTHDYLNVSGLSNFRKCHYEIYDLGGKIIQKSVLTNENIPISHLKSNTYIIRIYDGLHVFVGRFQVL